jgi:hypothetical protein
VMARPVEPAVDHGPNPLAEGVEQRCDCQRRAGDQEWGIAETQRARERTTTLPDEDSRPAASHIHPLKDAPRRYQAIPEVPR